MQGIRKQAFDSTSIASATYAAPQGTLDIQFPDGSTYRYFNVPPSTYTGLLDAVSKGRFFHRTIRGRFEYERVAADSGGA